MIRIFMVNIGLMLRHFYFLWISRLFAGNIRIKIMLFMKIHLTSWHLGVIMTFIALVIATITIVVKNTLATLINHHKISKETDHTLLPGNATFKFQKSKFIR